MLLWSTEIQYARAIWASAPESSSASGSDPSLSCRHVTVRPLAARSCSPEVPTNSHGNRAAPVCAASRAWSSVVQCQVVVVVVKDTDGEVARVAASLFEDLKERGVRVRLDDNVAQCFGWRATEWDLQGVPIRVELRPPDLAENTVLLYRRDTREKTTVSVDSVVEEVRG